MDLGGAHWMCPLERKWTPHSSTPLVSGTIPSLNGFAYFIAVLGPDMEGTIWVNMRGSLSERWIRALTILIRISITKVIPSQFLYEMGLNHKSDTISILIWDGFKSQQWYHFNPYTRCIWTRIVIPFQYLYKMSLNHNSDTISILIVYWFESQ